MSSFLENILSTFGERIERLPKMARRLFQRGKKLRNGFGDFAVHDKSWIEKACQYLRHFLEGALSAFCERVQCLPKMERRPSQSEKKPRTKFDDFGVRLTYCIEGACE